MKNQLITKLMPLIIMFALMPVQVFSTDTQVDEEKQFKYSDEQLLGFIDSNREISELRRASNERIEAVVENHDLTMERFNQIARAAQIGALQSGSFTDEEINAFNVVGPIINQNQRELQTEIQESLAEKDLTSAVYQEILRSYQQDQELQVYVREIMRERAIEAAREARRQELEEQQEDAE